MEENKTKAKIIAVAGKGGVGKTSLCSAIVRELVEAFPGKRILAIDADPAVGLSTALGVHVEHTIDDIRNEVIETSERGEYRQAIEVLNEARFRIFDTMVECDGFAFLAIGRPEAAGCYCSVNSYLKEVISMLANDFRLCGHRRRGRHRADQPPRHGAGLAPGPRHRPERQGRERLP